MKLKTTEIVMLVLVVSTFIIGYILFPYLPDNLAIHWNAEGIVNGYMNKSWGTFLLPFLLVVMYLLFLLVPRIDPKKSNIEHFRGYFDQFILVLFIFLIYIYALVLAWNLHYVFNFVQWLVPAFAILFYSIGILLSHTEMNWSIGIRTPWTLSNKEVWQKTHTLGGKLFKAAALVSLLGIIYPSQALVLVIIPITVVALWTIIYSYLEYKKLITK